MDKDKFLEKIKEVGTCEDEVTRRGILAEIQDEVSKIYDTNTTLTESNTKYVEDNEKLRQANLDLFLRVGSNKDAITQQLDETGIRKEEPKEYKSYEELGKSFL